jgi:hypothetical protein
VIVRAIMKWGSLQNLEEEKQGRKRPKKIRKTED